MEVSYDSFLEEYSRRKQIWKKLSVGITILSMLSGLLIIGPVGNYISPWFLDTPFEHPTLVTFCSVVITVVFTLLIAEWVVSIIDGILVRTYLKPYVIVELEDRVLVYGFVRDKLRTEFQLKLLKQYPEFELSPQEALAEKCSFVLVKK
ncbi:hypothetical protein [Vibrio mediterranei]|uniref:hypothetical protein n=1 Tax=Vibrio mediterranei TaxID=689 RepID=UPI0040695EFD